MKYNEIYLNASLDNKTIKINIHEAGEVVRKKESVKANILEIENRWFKLIDSLNTAVNSKAGPCELDKIKSFGMILGDDLLAESVKVKLNSTQSGFLFLELDEALINIPWELIFISNQFLCQRFYMGRSIQSRISASENLRKLNSVKNMWIMVNPDGSLEGSEKEGADLFEINKGNKWISTDIDSVATLITPEIAASRLRSYDMIHFAGHAKYLREQPEKSGWRLWNGFLTADIISRMKDGSPMPAFVFSNACQSGLTENLQTNESQNLSLFSLANAFLLSGVRHFLGVFWDIGDISAIKFASVFYEKLYAGKSVGESVNLARQAILHDDNSTNDLTWANYILYGDPATCYFPKKQSIAPSVTPPSSSSFSLSPQISPQSIRGRIIEWIQNSKQKQLEKQNKPMWRCFFILLFVFICCFSFFSVHQYYRIETYKILSERIQKKNEQYNKLILDLSHSSNGLKNSSIFKDSWTSKPATMSILYDQVQNIFNHNEDQYIVSVVERELLKHKRFKLLERMKWEILVPVDRMIDQKRFENFIQARFLLYLEIYRPDYYFFSSKAYCQLRMVDQENGTLEDVILEPIKNVTEKEFSQSLSTQLISAFNRLYPIRGIVSDISEQKELILNIGDSEGVVLGDSFCINHSKEFLTIKKVEAHRSYAQMNQTDHLPQKGVKVEWIKMQ
ncbi:CHAT domain protein [Candidatus Magnetomorum sp. HK-1]|nr:CHAT domain protein [Candidatus Magnetomorum sp. HK-1]